MKLRNYKYMFSLLPGAVTIFGNYAGGFWTFGNFVFSLVLLPALEFITPEDTSNVESESDVVPDLILVLHAVFQCSALVLLFDALHQHKFTGWPLLGAVLSTGLHSGSGALVVAHELIHRKNQLWQLLGKLLLFTAGNWYFYVEHLRVHHKHVGTTDDPATAHRGESLYDFFVRSLTGQLKGAWRLETSRMAKEGRSKFSFKNHVMASVTLTGIVIVLLYAVSGWVGPLVFFAQALIANFLLEYTNYIEHYGLQRQPGERTTEVHSWQSDKVISRFLLIDLSRHADHHYYASKPYHRLVSFQNSPVLPAGYTSSFYLALLPPVWFRLVDRRLDEFKANQS